MMNPDFSLARYSYAYKEPRRGDLTRNAIFVSGALVRSALEGLSPSQCAHRWWFAVGGYVAGETANGEREKE